MVLLTIPQLGDPEPLRVEAHDGAFQQQTERRLLHQLQLQLFLWHGHDPQPAGLHISL